MQQRSHCHALNYNRRPPLSPAVISAPLGCTVLTRPPAHASPRQPSLSAAVISACLGCTGAHSPARTRLASAAVAQPCCHLRLPRLYGCSLARPHTPRLGSRRSALLSSPPPSAVRVLTRPPAHASPRQPSLSPAVISAPLGCTVLTRPPAHASPRQPPLSPAVISASLGCTGAHSPARTRLASAAVAQPCCHLRLPRLYGCSLARPHTPLLGSRRSALLSSLPPSAVRVLTRPPAHASPRQPPLSPAVISAPLGCTVLTRPPAHASPRQPSLSPAVISAPLGCTVLTRPPAHASPRQPPLSPAVISASLGCTGAHSPARTRLASAAAAQRCCHLRLPRLYGCSLARPHTPRLGSRRSALLSSPPPSAVRVLTRPPAHASPRQPSLSPSVISACLGCTGAHSPARTRLASAAAAQRCCHLRLPRLYGCSLARPHTPRLGSRRSALLSSPPPSAVRVLTRPPAHASPRQPSLSPAVISAPLGCTVLTRPPAHASPRQPSLSPAVISACLGCTGAHSPARTRLASAAAAQRCCHLRLPRLYGCSLARPHTPRLGSRRSALLSSPPPSAVRVLTRPPAHASPRQPSLSPAVISAPLGCTVLTRPPAHASPRQPSLSPAVISACLGCTGAHSPARPHTPRLGSRRSALLSSPPPSAVRVLTRPPAHASPRQPSLSPAVISACLGCTGAHSPARTRLASAAAAQRCCHLRLPRLYGCSLARPHTPRLGSRRSALLSSPPPSAVRVLTRPPAHASPRQPPLSPAVISASLGCTGAHSPARTRLASAAVAQPCCHLRPPRLYGAHSPARTRLASAAGSRSAPRKGHSASDADSLMDGSRSEFQIQQETTGVAVGGKSREQTEGQESMMCYRLHSWRRVRKTRFRRTVAPGQLQRHYWQGKVWAANSSPSRSEQQQQQQGRLQPH
ncbi:proline-rich protein 36-like [Schistocerca serialis cubense]|uniref:proline-rich protein 36-like n=1 Tax=Schistocerca serialis cubense TaxID=2023355 RepID=UPI00214F38AB|nr:proline-rich protein 36-like [Schistocerca serialis cubense]